MPAPEFFIVTRVGVYVSVTGSNKSAVKALLSPAETMAYTCIMTFVNSLAEARGRSLFMVVSELLLVEIFVRTLFFSLSV